MKGKVIPLINGLITHGRTPDVPHRKREFRTKNFLSYGEVIKLTKELMAMQEEIHREKPTLADLAERLSVRLMFKVTAANLEFQIKEGTVKDWRPRAQDTGRCSTADLLTRMQDLEGRIAMQEDVIERLEAESAEHGRATALLMAKTAILSRDLLKLAGKGEPDH